MSKTKLILIFILLFAFVLRFWNLGGVPVSLDWDEASLGYNAFSILQTGRDEYGSFMPVMLKSFGDYKPALYAYTAIPSVAIFGLESFAVRLPSAIFGIFSVLLTFILVKELFKNTKLALLSALLLAISPWHIQFSRTAFEANLGLTLNLLTVVLFIKGLKRPYLLIFSAITSALSIYAYQSEKIFAPLLMLLLIAIFWKELKGIGRKYILAFLVIGLFVVSPMLFLTIKNPESLNRARATITSDDKFFSHTGTRMAANRENNDFLGIAFDNSKVKFVKQSIGSYLSHYDLNWLFITGDLPRHHAPYMGLLYLWELPFLLVGLYFLIFDRRIGNKTKILIVGWILLAPVPASITNDVPHSVRTLNFLPTFQIVSAMGILYSYLWLNKRIKLNLVRNIVVTSIALFALINFLFYLNQYFVQQNYFYSKEWQYGYKEAVDFIKAEGNEYEKIIVSDEVPLDQSYIFFLYHLKYDPDKLQKSGHSLASHNFDKLEFRKISWDQDKNSNNTLFMGNPGDFKEDGKTLKTINYLNGEEAIRIVEPLSSTF